MKLNKTEQAILDKMKRDRSTTVGLDTGSQGRGKNRKFGTRKHNAILSLRDKGILELVPGSQGETPLYSKDGFGINGWVRTSAWRLV